MADLTDMLEEEFKEEKIFKTFEIKQDKVDTDNRTFKAVLTSEVIDKDGEIVKIDEYFSNGLRYPNDIDGAAENVIRCRCTVLPEE